MPTLSTTPPIDDELIEIKVADGKTLSVRNALLMHSSVFRDAFHVQALSESNTGGIKAKNLDLEMNCSLVAAKLLFAMLAGQDYKSLSSTSSDDDKELRDLLTTQKPDIPLVPVLRDVLAQADFLDIPLVPQLLVAILFSIGRRGQYQSISVFAIAVQLGHVALAEFAIERMVGLPSPLAYADSTVQSLGLVAWRCLIRAYHEAIVPTQGSYKRVWNSSSLEWQYESIQVSIAWTGDASQWKTLSRAIMLS